MDTTFFYTGTNDARVKWCKDMLKKFNQGASKNVYKIVTDDESWIYSYEPERKSQSAVWVFQNEQKLTKLVRARSVGKQMVAFFFSKTGHISTVALEDRKTVNSDWYTTICLPEVFSELRKNQSKRRIILHHDDATSHTSNLSSEHLSPKNIELMGHPSYSPNLESNEFFLLPTIKDQLRGQLFSLPEEAINGKVCESSWRIF